VLEQDDRNGGLTGGLDVGGVSLERFYQHWFASDVHVAQLIEQLGLQDRLVFHETRTGMCFADRFFRLGDPST